jgi:hypothetical protein
MNEIEELKGRLRKEENDVKDGLGGYTDQLPSPIVCPIISLPPLNGSIL